MIINKEPVPGWVGGFAQSNEKFAAPNYDLSSLDMLENMANIDKLQRQQKVLWPEFSWTTELGDPEKRCYVMFAPDISRLGYTNEGRVYSIICPQQGLYLEGKGCMNVEVTVTGQRGWVDEDTKTLAADMKVEGKIWFSPATHQKWFFKLISFAFRNNDLPFPSEKSKAITVKTFKPSEPSQPIFPLRSGETKDFPIPEFARHPESWDVAHLSVQIGDIVPTGNAEVDMFNELVLKIFNITSGNMLKKDNILSWNVWFTAPEHVNQEEWRTHAERWRLSIDEGHGSPDGEGSSPRFFDGTPFKPAKQFVNDVAKEIINHILEHKKIPWWVKLMFRVASIFK